MAYSRIPLAVLAAILISTGTAEAAGLEIDPPVVIDVPEVSREIVHLGDGESAGGGGDGAPAILKRGASTEDASSGIPGNAPGGDSAGTGQPFGNAAEENGDYALVCEVTPDGALQLANRGSETMPSGARIRWKAGSQRGAFRLNIDLEPGAGAAAPDMIADDSITTCWAAAVI